MAFDLHVDLVRAHAVELYNTSKTSFPLPWNLLNLPLVFFRQLFIVCFHLHLIKAQLNSCDTQANNILNFCKCFLLEKR